MLKLKSAQTNFTDVNVRRILGYIEEEKSKCEQKLQVIGQIQNDLTYNLGIQENTSIQDLQSDPELWGMMQSVLGADHWSFNPNQGMVE